MPGTFTGVAVLAVAALPLAALAVLALGSGRRLGSALAEIGIVYGTVPWVWLTLLPGRHGEGVLSLVPLRDLLTMSSAQVVGNLLIFAALGFFGPLRFAALASLPRMLAVSAAGSLLIESTQYLLLDRVASVDDVLLNTAGAGLAAWASRQGWRPGARSRPADYSV